MSKAPGIAGGVISLFILAVLPIAITTIGSWVSVATGVGLAPFLLLAVVGTWLAERSGPTTTVVAAATHLRNRTIIRGVLGVVGAVSIVVVNVVGVADQQVTATVVGDLVAVGYSLAYVMTRRTRATPGAPGS